MASETPAKRPVFRARTLEHKTAHKAMIRSIRSEAELTYPYTGRSELSTGVIDAISNVPRHAFVPDESRTRAYDDRPLSIGYGQTISQPFIVALMTDLLDLEPDARVLEVGAGSGYQAAVLAGVAANVFTVEWIPELAVAAKERLARLGYGNVRVRQGDGVEGWPGEAPFDGILLSCATAEIPTSLIRQLAPGGRLIAPVGPQWTTQMLTVFAAGMENEVSRRPVLPVAFVPLVQGLGNKQARGQ